MRKRLFRVAMDFEGASVVQVEARNEDEAADRVLAGYGKILSSGITDKEIIEIYEVEDDD
jgi:hypothetical protein